MYARAARQFLLMLLAIGVSTIAFAQSVFPGRITLPKGYVLKKPRCMDSYCGSFVKDGSPTIQFDIGDMAGVYANESVEKSDLISRRNVTLPNQTAVVLIHRISRHDQKQMKGRYASYDPQLKSIVVSFPDSKANFYAFVHTQQEIDFVETAALTFVPDSSLKRPDNPFEPRSK